jgi:hypothetical protein
LSNRLKDYTNDPQAVEDCVALINKTVALVNQNIETPILNSTPKVLLSKMGKKKKKKKNKINK